MKDPDTSILKFRVRHMLPYRGKGEQYQKVNRLIIEDEYNVDIPPRRRIMLARPLI